MKGRSQALVYGCLLLSGSTSLVYELLWTRIFSFSFGSTSLAFAAVLAVFFLGLAGGSVLGGRMARRLRNPLRAYGWLELLIGAYAGLAFPLLFKLHHLFALHNAGGAEPSGLAFRFLAATAVLAVPTLCMGATFPVLLEHLRRERSHLSEALGRLYGVNTLGAFLGVYAATHWLIPGLGLDKANYAAVALNAAVFALAWMGGRHPAPAHGDAPAAAAEAAAASGAGANPRLAWIGLILLSASGFVSLAYEVVWGRVLTISLEGSLYGIGTTLGSFLAGIGLGGLVFSVVARRLQDPARLFRAYVLVCIAVIGYLALSRLLLPVEGYLLKAVNHSVRGLLGLHANFGIGVLFLLPITAGLGFMFPAAVALYTHGRANPAEGAGRAYALNTAMSVLGSLLSASLLMDWLGIEGIVFLGALIMLGTLLAAVLLAEAGKPDRRVWLGVVALPLLLCAGWWPAIDAKTVLLGGYDGKPPNLPMLFGNLAQQFGPRDALKIYKDGVGTTLTVVLAGRSVGLQSNGLPQSGRDMDPPHFNLESSLVGLLPAMHKPGAGNALVVGLGAGITVGVLRMAGIPSVEVVELEPSMADICRSVYPRDRSPLDDTGVTLHLDDARNFLVRNGYREEPRRWSLIASQPAHPWVSGAADLFTEEMFRLAYANLAEGGVFCQWFMASGIDEKSFMALSNAFGRVFDEAIVYRSFGVIPGLYFIGSRGQPGFSLAGAEEVFARPGLKRLLELHGHSRPVDVFKYAATPLGPGAALIAEGPVNRDRNAYVEARMPLLPKSSGLPEGGPKARPFSGPGLAGFREAAARDTLFIFEAIDGLSGNIPSPRPPEVDSQRIRRMAAFRDAAKPPFRDYYDAHLAFALGRLTPDGVDTAAERARAAGLPLLAAQFRLLRLKLGPASAADPAASRAAAGLPDSLPAGFRAAFAAARLLAAAGAAHSRSQGLPHPGPDREGIWKATDSLASLPGADSLASALAALLKAHALQAPSRFAPGSDLLEKLYRECLLEWAHQETWVEALEWHCRATGQAEKALMARRMMVNRAEEAEKRAMEKAAYLRRQRRNAEALQLYAQALRRNPALQAAYQAMAEIHTMERNKAGVDSLASAIHRAFPIPDVMLVRLQETWEKGAQVAAEGEKSGN